MKIKFLNYFLYFLIFIIIFAITIYFLPTNKYTWVKNLKESIPQKYKNQFKKTVFIIPELYKKNLSLKKEIKDLKEQTELNRSNLNLLNSQINGIKLKNTNIIITKKNSIFKNCQLW